MGNTLEDLKKRAAERAVDFVRDGQIVGLGTGSTTWFALQALGQRVRQGLQITGVATSRQTESIAKDLGIPLKSLNDVQNLDLAIDGADEVDANFNMIKGGGGALTREKLVALAALQRIIIVDDKKLVSTLGIGFPLPVEVLPFAWAMTTNHLATLGCEPRLRVSGDRIFETDNNNYIVDCKFKGIAEVAALEAQIKLMPGVVECGLFVGICDVLVLGSEAGVEVLYRKDCN